MFGGFDLLCTLSGCYTLLFSFGMCNFVFIFPYIFLENKSIKIRLNYFSRLSLTLAFEDCFFHDLKCVIGVQYIIMNIYISIELCYNV